MSSAVAGEGGGQSVECAADGVRGGLCLWTSDIFPGDIYLNTGVTSESQSLPSFTDHTPALSLSLNVSNIQIQGGGMSGVSKGWRERWIELDQLEGSVNRFGPMEPLLIFREWSSGDILQQQKLYYCGVSREQELSEGMRGGGGKLGQSLWREEKLC